MARTTHQELRKGGLSIYEIIILIGLKARHTSHNYKEEGFKDKILITLLREYKRSLEQLK